MYYKRKKNKKKTRILLKKRIHATIEHKLHQTSVFSFTINFPIINSITLPWAKSFRVIPTNCWFSFQSFLVGSSSTSRRLSTNVLPKPRRTKRLEGHMIYSHKIGRRRKCDGESLLDHSVWQGNTYQETHPLWSNW